jgi:hypothetical protein
MEVMAWCKRSDCKQLTETPEGGNIWQDAKKGDLVVIWEGPRDDVRAFVRDIVRYKITVGPPYAAMVTMLTALRGEFKVGGFLTTDPKYGRELPAAPPAWFPSGHGFPITVYDHLLV